MPGVLQRGERVLADDAIGVEVMGLLEGNDGVVGSRTRRPVDRKMLPVRSAISELPQRPLYGFDVRDAMGLTVSLARSG